MNTPVPKWLPFAFILAATVPAHADPATNAHALEGNWHAHTSAFHWVRFVVLGNDHGNFDGAREPANCVHTSPCTPVVLHGTFTLHGTDLTLTVTPGPTPLRFAYSLAGTTLSLRVPGASGSTAAETLDRGPEPSCPPPNSVGCMPGPGVDLPPACSDTVLRIRCPGVVTD